MANPIYGDAAAVHFDDANVANVGKWNINPNDTVIEYQTSGTAGAPAQADGNSNWDGTFDTYGVIPIVWPGTTFKFEGTIDGATGAFTGAAGAVCTQFKIDMNFENGEPIKQIITFGSAGAAGTLTIGPVTAVGAVADIPAGVDSTMKLALLPAGATYASGTHDRPDIKSISLTLGLKVTEYATSGDAGVMNRSLGHPILSCQFVEMLNATDGFTEVFTSSSPEMELRIYTEATKFYEFRYVKFENPSLEVDTESGEPVETTQTMKYQPIGDSPILAGYIVKPDLTEFFGTVPPP